MSADFSHDIHADLAEGRVMELAELYALDALNEQDRALVDAYLADASADVKREFSTRLMAARGVLSETFSPTMDPPAGLFSSIQERISAQAPAGAHAAANEAGTASADATPETAPATDELSRRRAQNLAAGEPTHAPRVSRRRRTWRAWTIGIAAAAALAIVGAVGLSGILNQKSPADQVISASDVRTVTVKVQGGGTAKVSISQSVNAATVKLNDVSAPSKGDTYQLWMLPKNDGAPRSEGLMGTPTQMDQPALVKDISAAKAVAITLEPAGGSAAPTSEPIMVAALKS